MALHIQDGPGRTGAIHTQIVTKAVASSSKFVLYPPARFQNSIPVDAQLPHFVCNINFDAMLFLWHNAAKSNFFSAAELRAVHGERKLRLRPAARVHVQGGLRADQRRSDRRNHHNSQVSEWGGEVRFCQRCLSFRGSYQINLDGEKPKRYSSKE